MILLSSALFAISASLDAFIVGIGYGIRKVHIPFLQNLLISLITLLGTVFSILFGQTLAPLLPPGYAGRAGNALLILMGSFYLIKFMLRFLPKCQSSGAEVNSCAKKEPETLTNLWAVLLLGFTLSINNVGIGISASIAGLSLLPSAALTMLFSVTLLALGNRLGQARLLQKAERYAEPLSGLLLIGLGLL